MRIPSPFTNGAQPRKLWLALSLRPFFFGVRVGPWWVKLRSADYVLFSERYGGTWSHQLLNLRLSVCR